MVAALAGTSACTRFGYDPVVRPRETLDAGKTPFDAGSRPDARLDASAPAQPHDAASGVDNPAYALDAGSADTRAASSEDAAVAVADPVAPVDATDAAVPPADPTDPADAGPGEPPPVSDCGDGASLGGVCWYLAPLGTPCMTFCESLGTYTPALSYVGDRAQGGSVERCDLVLDLLVGPGSTQSGYRIDGNGLGGHAFNRDRWRLNAGPAFSPTASHSKAQLACSCTGPGAG